ncbi:MAG: beta strand repeat-containing protein [Myxococcota bacterium]
MHTTRVLAALSLFALAGCPRQVIELNSLSVTPDNGRVIRGEAAQYVATALFSNGEAREVTAEALWSVDDAWVGEVSATGLVRGLHEGQTVVRVRYGEKMITRPLTVTGAVLRSLEIDPPHPIIPAGLSQALTVTGIDSDGAKRDVTAEAVWTTIAPHLVSLSDARVLGRAPGTTTITASVQGLLVSVPVDVTAATITQLDVQPATLSLPKGAAARLSATALLSDGSSLDVSTQATWRSSDATVVFASEVPAEGGQLVARAPGAAQVSATVLGRSGQAAVTVTDAALASLELSPPTATLAAGTSQRFVLTGVFTDGARLDLSTQAGWASSNSQVLAIDAGGLARALSAGQAQLTASFGGQSLRRTITVSAATLVALELTPSQPSVARGLTLDLSAFGRFSDGSRQDVTSLAVWRIADPSLATVSNAAATSGRVTGLAEGLTTISATVGATSASVPLTVSAASLVSLQVSPATPSLPLGTRRAFTATGLFSDGSTQDLTAQVTWTSSAPSCVSISSQGSVRGEAIALALGQATVTASLGGRSAGTLVTVTDAVLERIDVSPAQLSLPLGVFADFVATGVYSGGAAVDLTAQVTWRSSAPTVLELSNAPGTQGRARGLTLGQATVSAQLGAISGQATITVSQATVTRLELSPSAATLAVGLTRAFSVTAVYSDASTLDVTAQSSFSVVDPSLAAASNAPASRGEVTALRAGATELVANAMGLEARAALTVTPAVPVALAISPPLLTLAVGTSATLHAEASLSDGSTADVSTSVSWSSGAATITVSNATGTEGLVTAVSVGSATVRAQLGTLSATASITASPATLTALELAPTNPAVPLGATQQLTATGRFSDGSAQDLTALATWTSALPAVVTVSNAPGSIGRLTAVARGAATVSATFASVTASTLVSVTSATLARVDLSPATPRLAKDTRLRLRATGVWTDGATQDLTEACTWASLAPALATVSNAPGTRGRVSALAAGTAPITATCSGVTGSVDVTVTNATLTTIELTPPAPGAAAGFSQQLEATGVFSDGTTQPFTDFVAWASSDLSRATVSNTAGTEGLVLARAQGAVTISATALGVTGSTVFTVSAAVLQGLELTPAVTAVPKGLTQSFTALGHFSDGTTAPVTEAATWNTSAPAVATVSNAAGSRGLTAALLEGTATISATLGGFSASASLTVSPAALTSLSVTPTAVSLARGLSRQFAATGTFSDGTTRDLTTSVTWSVVDGAIARVSNVDGSRGLVQTLAVGTTALAATQGAISGSTSLTVTPAELVSLGLTPATPSVPRGLDVQLVVTGVYTDGAVQDLTSQATWASGDPSKVTVSNAPGSHGLAHGLAQGSATVSAAWGGFTATVTVSVTAAVLQRLELTPATPSVAAGLTIALTATGVYSDATTADLTGSASWSSLDASVATVSAGVVSGVRVGTTSITATVGAVTGATTLDVTAAVLQAIQVTPQNASRPRGLSQQFTATGVFSDATTANLTTSVTWASSAPAVASVSNADGSRGLASSLNVGSVTISATLGSISGSTPFTVTPAQLNGLLLTPGSGSAPLGSVRQYTATGTYTDGTTQPLTTVAAWSSSNPAVATISNASGSQGLATTLATGATTITATSGGFTRSSSLVVTQTTLTRIDLSPTAGSTALGYTRQLIAIGTYSDGTTQLLTDQVTWSTSDANTAIISNAAGSRGLLSTVAVGQVIVTATLGSVTGSTTHDVTPAVLVFLSLAPSTLTLANGSSAAATATGYFSDGSTADLTTSVTWTTSAPAVAQVSNAAGSEGLITAISPGQATISATLGPVSATLDVTVN